MPWLPGYTRRKSKGLTASLAGTQYDYPMRLTIYKQGLGPDNPTEVFLGGHCRDDFWDIRFTSNDQTTLLNYWIESYVSGNYAIVWIKVPTVPPPTGVSRIYIYYDNPDITISLSNELGVWNIFSYSSQFSSTQGQNGWYYQYWDGSNYYDMTWGTRAYTYPIWWGPQWNLQLHWVQIHPGPSLDSAAKWVVPFNSVLRITGKHARGDTGGNGTNAKILKNTTILFDSTLPGSGDPREEAFNIETIANSGDAIYFRVNARGDDGYDTTIFLPTIKIRKYASPEPTFGTSGTEELDMTATLMTLDKTSCIGPCSVGIGVEWQNFGNADITYRPAVIIDQGTPDSIIAYGTTDIIIPAKGGKSSGLISTPTLSAGNHIICPYPN